eukprot:scaffold237885_cov25-Tisochrysis_lutea.AAC.3
MPIPAAGASALRSGPSPCATRAARRVTRPPGLRCRQCAAATHGRGRRAAPAASPSSPIPLPPRRPGGQAPARRPRRGRPGARGAIHR